MREKVDRSNPCHWPASVVHYQAIMLRVALRLKTYAVLPCHALTFDVRRTTWPATCHAQSVWPEDGVPTMIIVSNWAQKGDYLVPGKSDRPWLAEVLEWSLALECCVVVACVKYWISGREQGGVRRGQLVTIYARCMLTVTHRCSVRVRRMSSQWWTVESPSCAIPHWPSSTVHVGYKKLA
jgi:hypothetical protein